MDWRTAHDTFVAHATAPRGSSCDLPVELATDDAYADFLTTQAYALLP